MLRYQEEGWIRIGRYDSARRRSLWARRTDGERIEVCAGREGDDCYAVVGVDNPIHDSLLYQLWAQEDMGPDDEADAEIADVAREYVWQLRRTNEDPTSDNYADQQAALTRVIELAGGSHDPRRP